MLLKAWFKYTFIGRCTEVTSREKNCNTTVHCIFKYETVLKLFHPKILQNKITDQAIFQFFNFNKMPINYNFEIEKSLKKLYNSKSKKIYIQLPEGLQKFYIILSDFFKMFCFYCLDTNTSNRITYGACCIDDISSKLIGAELSLHYGHSCLVPIIECMIPLSYIFLEIYFDQSFLIEMLKVNFSKKEFFWTFVSTIQFVSCLKKIEIDLLPFFKYLDIPQNKPLSPGELLGCTSPVDLNRKNIIYIGDGRFHLESGMISSPVSRFFQYNPFSHMFFVTDFSVKEFLEEREFVLMKSFLGKKHLGLILGSLGRQGSVIIFRKMREILDLTKLDFFSSSASEISLANFDILGYKKINIWTQIACPRLSYDWSKFLNYPLLSPFELSFLLGLAISNKTSYPMDYYSEKGKFWTTYMNPGARYVKY